MATEAVRTLPEEGGRRSGRPKAGETARLHIALPEELIEKLRVMQQETYASSIGEVIKTALIVYAALLEEHKDGREVYTRSRSGGDQHKMAIFL